MVATRKKTTRRRSPARRSKPAYEPMLPEYMPMQSRKGASPLLVVLVIVLAFFTGYLFFKVQNLEKNSAGSAAVDQGTAGAAAPSGPVNVDPGHLPVLGNKNAPVTVIEFADFRCPFCEKLFTDVAPSLKKDYIDTGKVKFYFRHYAFLGDASTVAANAAECANAQGKFWEMHDYLFQNQPSESDTSMYTTDNLTSVAGQLGLNTSQFSSCLDSKKYNKNVSDDLSAGQKAGVQGTPSTFVNGIMIDGAQPYSNFKAEIDKALSK